MTRKRPTRFRGFFETTDRRARRCSACERVIVAGATVWIGPGGKSCCGRKCINRTVRAPAHDDGIF